MRSAHVPDHPSIPDEFQAFRIHNDSDGYRSGVEMVSLNDLSPGDVTIRAHYSSVNYKDALAGTGKGKNRQAYFPLMAVST